MADKWWPSVGKIFQLVPTRRDYKCRAFREILTRHGFNWDGLDCDHVQDVFWEGDDDFPNLWPADRSANRSAGARSDWQMIAFCITSSGPYVMYTLRDLKSMTGFYGRWFRIAAVSR